MIQFFRYICTCVHFLNHWNDSVKIRIKSFQRKLNQSHSSPFCTNEMEREVTLIEISLKGFL